MELEADCGACAGLCCVAPGFAASADFAVSKPAGSPCPHLSVTAVGTPAPCTIHGELTGRGFPGCVTFDCFGAGQAVTAVTDWRAGRAAEAFAAFDAVRGLHEILWYLTEPFDDLPAGLRSEVAGATDRVRRMAARLGEGVDLGAVRGEVGGLLGRVSAAVRPDGAASRTRADLVGCDLRRHRLTDAGLRGALLVGADLRGVDLGRADLLGADLRGADLRGARLARTVFLTTPQVAAARGDATTTLPARVRRPGHWS